MADCVVPFVVPLIATVAVDVTGRVVTAKVAFVAPDGMVTFVGTVAAEVFALARLTTTPVGPAAPVSVTVPVTAVAEPPVTLVGESVTVCTPGAWTVRVAV